MAHRCSFCLPRPPALFPFQGPVVVTTNCLIEPQKAYKDRIYTRSAPAMRPSPLGRVRLTSPSPREQGRCRMARGQAHQGLGLSISGSDRAGAGHAWIYRGQA